MTSREAVAISCQRIPPGAVMQSRSLAAEEYLASHRRPGGDRLLAQIEAHMLLQCRRKRLGERTVPFALPEHESYPIGLQLIERQEWIVRMERNWLFPEWLWRPRAFVHWAGVC